MVKILRKPKKNAFNWNETNQALNENFHKKITLCSVYIIPKMNSKNQSSTTTKTLYYNGGLQ